MSADVLDGLRAMIADEVAKAMVKLRAELAVPDEFLSTQAAADFADVAPGTLRRWIREGRLTGQKAGRCVRIRRSDLERLLRMPERDDDSPEARVARDFG